MGFGVDRDDLLQARLGGVGELAEGPFDCAEDVEEAGAAGGS